jgi:hypothetical protein
LCRCLAAWQPPCWASSAARRGEGHVWRPACMTMPRQPTQKTRVREFPPPPGVLTCCPPARCLAGARGVMASQRPGMIIRWGAQSNGSIACNALALPASRMSPFQAFSLLLSTPPLPPPPPAHAPLPMLHAASSMLKKSAKTNKNKRNAMLHAPVLRSAFSCGSGQRFWRVPTCGGMWAPARLWPVRRGGPADDSAGAHARSAGCCPAPGAHCPLAAAHPLCGSVKTAGRRRGSSRVGCARVYACCVSRRHPPCNHLGKTWHCPLCIRL